MAVQLALLTVAACCACGSAFGFLMPAVERIRRRRLATALRTRIGSRRRVMSGAALRLMPRRLREPASALVVSAGFAHDPQRAVDRFATMASCSGVVAGAVSASPVVAVCATAVASVAVVLYLRDRRDASIDRFRRQLPDALTLVASALSSGQSLVQALSYASTETPDPLSSELAHVVDEVRSGSTLADALRSLSSRLPVRELDSVLVAVELQYRTGGNLAELLRSTAGSLQSSEELRRSLRVQTSQARFSARMVGLLPVGLMAVLSLFSREYVTGLFGSPAGMACLAAAALMEAVGFVLVERVARVEV